MATQLLARRDVYGASSSRQVVSRRSWLVVKAYLPNAAQTPDLQPGETRKIKLPATPEATKAPGPRAKVTFQLPRHVDFGQDICLVGEDPALGDWDVSKCVPMAWHEGDVWTADAELPEGAKIEYKYVRRAAEDMGGDVIEWLPEPSNFALEIGAPEVTVRDGWVGDSHEILEGLLPVPPPPPPPPAAETADEGAEFLSAMIDPSAAQDFPAFKPSASPENPVYGQPQPPITSAPVAVTNVVSAKDVAEFPVAADVVPRAGNQSNTEGFTAEENSAGVAEGPTAVDAVPITPPAATSFTRKIRRSPAEGRNNNKSFGSQNTVAASSVNQAPQYAALPTSDLKQLCKERGLPAKGQRSELIARLHLLQQQ